jgi:hypothetical protein
LKLPTNQRISTSIAHAFTAHKSFPNLRIRNSLVETVFSIDIYIQKFQDTAQRESLLILINTFCVSWIHGYRSLLFSERVSFGIWPALVR